MKRITLTRVSETNKQKNGSLIAATYSRCRFGRSGRLVMKSEHVEKGEIASSILATRSETNKKKNGALIAATYRRCRFGCSGRLVMKSEHIEKR